MVWYGHKNQLTGFPLFWKVKELCWWSGSDFSTFAVFVSDQKRDELFGLFRLDFLLFIMSFLS